MSGRSSCGTTVPLMDRDRTSDVPSPCYVAARDRLAICVSGVFLWLSLSLFLCGARVRWAAAAIVPVTCTVHATCIHETDLQSVWPGVLSLDMGPMCVTLGFNVILAVVR